MMFEGGIVGVGSTPLLSEDAISRQLSKRANGTAGWCSHQTISC